MGRKDAHCTLEGREMLWKPSGIQNDVGRRCSSTIMLNIGIWSGPTYAMTRARPLQLIISISAEWDL